MIAVRNAVCLRSYGNTASVFRSPPPRAGSGRRSNVMNGSLLCPPKFFSEKVMEGHVPVAAQKKYVCSILKQANQGFSVNGIHAYAITVAGIQGDMCQEYN